MFARHASGRRRRLSQAVRPVIEGLETRRMFTTFVVNTTEASSDSDGLLSLREAITAASTDTANFYARAGSSADVITFDPTVFATPQTISVQELIISDTEDVVVDGGGTVTFDGGNQGRMFRLEGVGAKLTLKNLTLAHGAADNGGAIINNGGELVVNSCQFIGNTAKGVGNFVNGVFQVNLPGAGLGAGSPGALAFKGGFGGAIYNAGTLNITGSLFEDNQAFGSAGGVGGSNGGGGGGGGAGLGGAIFSASGVVSIDSTTIHRNIAWGGTGGNGDYGVTASGDYGGGGAGGGPQGGTPGSGTPAGLGSGGAGPRGDGFGGSDGGFGGGGGSGQNGGFGGGGGGSIAGSAGVGGFGAGSGSTDFTFGGGGAGMGGGIFVAGGSVVLTNSTLFRNVAASSDYTIGDGSGMGGAAFVYGGSLSLVNSTVIYNAAVALGNSVYGDNSAYGGGIFVYDGTLNLVNATVAYNTSAPPDGAGSSYGGGIYAYGGDVNLANTILALNTAQNGPDGHGTFISGGHNLIGDQTSTTGFSAGAGDLLNVADPKLSPLGDYGGPTQTIYLLPGSPAIDAGSNAVATGAGLTKDQRGFARFVGARVDIGAVESTAVPTAPSGLTGQAISNSAVKLNWIDTATTETGFEVQYSKKSNFSSPTTVAVPGGANVNTFTVPGLSAKTWYYFRVRALGYAGTSSAYSKSVKVKTLKAVPAPKPQITSLQLVNSDTDQTVYTITDGEQLSKNGILAYLGVTHFSIKANVTGPAESVKFGYQGKAKFATDNLAPFSLFGDDGATDYFGQLLDIGTYTITATPFSQDGASGVAGSKVTLHFSVVA